MMMMILKIPVCFKKELYSIYFNNILVKKSPLLPSSSSDVVRRKSSVRNPSVPMRRSSLNMETQFAIRQNRLSQTYSNTPPIIKKV